jgi:hypothetical protein
MYSRLEAARANNDYASMDRFRAELDMLENEIQNKKVLLFKISFF